jgi:hypothetical protein
MATSSAYSATSSPESCRHRTFKIVFMAGPSIAQTDYAFESLKSLSTYILFFLRLSNHLQLATPHEVDHAAALAF